MRRLLVLLGILSASSAFARVGADLPWTSYAAEAMATNGRVLGPGYLPNTIETESSGQRCVQLTAAGDYVEFTAGSAANALVLRYSLPDAVGGGGTTGSLDLLINGKLARRLELTSRFAWLYGSYPFSNDPAQGRPRNFYDELRVRDLAIPAGAVVRLQRGILDAPYCILDLVDLEAVPAPRPAPREALSVLGFGADPRGASDSTAALRRAVAAARDQHRTVWLPAGDFKVTGEILVPSGVTVQGAGMWYTRLVGDEALYGQAARRVRVKLAGSHILLADFAILGRLSYRNDSEPNDGIVGAGCADSVIERIWIEHTKVGIWIYNGVRLTIEGCRLRDTIADGVNLCVGANGNVVQDCAARGTGDDCFAIWPAASDQGFVTAGPKPGHNVIRRCTGQLPFLANGAAVYGGESNRVEDCVFTDIGTGCGVLISTTFPTSDDGLHIDNNFSGLTEVRHCELLRCGGYDHDWAWRGSVQVCLHRRSITGLLLTQVSVRDSISSGITVVAPGGARGEGTLANARLEAVEVTGSGLGGSPHHDLWIYPGAHGSLALDRSIVADVRNEAEGFTLPITR